MTTYKYGQQLPAEVEQALDGYIERIKNIKWFKPGNLKKTDVDTKINFALKCFGEEAGVDYRSLHTLPDWDYAGGLAWDAAHSVTGAAAWNVAKDVTKDIVKDAAWSAARTAAWGAAWESAWEATQDIAKNIAQTAVWDNAWDVAQDMAQMSARDAASAAAWSAARGADGVLALSIENKNYSKRYPNGNFLYLIDLWEMGLFPTGIVSGQFVCYVPTVHGDVSELMPRQHIITITEL